jgi:RNA polymerase sigma factor (TIGR02999 family)
MEHDNGPAPALSETEFQFWLAAAAEGDALARDRVIELMYGQLHRLASVILNGERRGGTLQTTALVNEAVLRLVGGSPLKAADRKHLLNVAAIQMRRILIDHARARNAGKRQGARVSLEDAGQIALNRGPELIALDDALNALSRIDAAAADVVEKKYFGGYTDEETAEVLGISVAKVRRDWTYARAWLHDHIGSVHGKDA